MKKYLLLLIVLALFFGCKTASNTVSTDKVIVTFGSCNKHDSENVFWDDILAQKPDVFIWGGDIVYADTDKVDKIRAFYQMQDKVPAYASLKKQVFITGTWDDHDYGLNDGGEEFISKQGSQQAFLDFMDVPKDSPRRKQEGVYSSQMISKQGALVKIINLDTRYFRTKLTDDRGKGRRYKPNPVGEGTILGDLQWKWLESELSNSKADFNLIVSSIQFLSSEHGFEKWANHPSEVQKMKQLIAKSNAKGVIILSGDRHISEFSKAQVANLSYPLVDFTSSGLTHSYSNFNSEPNQYRVKEVTAVPSFGMLELNVKSRNATMKILGDNGVVLQELKQSY
jgi:alkaline phosphatase D